MASPEKRASSLGENDGPKHAELVEDPDAGLDEETRAKIVGSHPRRVGVFGASN